MAVSLVDLLTYHIVEVSHDEFDWFQIFYFGFNTVEAVAWFVFAILVLIRWAKNQKTALEIGYSLLFLLFGLSDVMEIISYPLWLLLAKAIILTGLLLTRRHLIRTHYHGNKF